jgi:tetratricopeptide (TPR) repeat protein
MSVSRQDLLQNAVKAHRKGDVSTAERLYSKLLRQLPGDFNALHLLGIIRVQQQRFSEADRLIAKALEVNVNAEALNNHGGVLVELGRYDEAIKRLNRALSMKPDYAEAHFNLGNALRKSGQPAEAVKSFAAAVRIRPNYVEALQNQSDALRELNRQTEAITALRQAIKISPGNTQLHNNLGILLRDMGDLEEARRVFKRAISLDSGFVSAYYNLVRCGGVQSDDDVIAAMEALVPSAGTLPLDERTRLQFALGQAYDDVGRYDEAFASLREANSAARSLIHYDEGEVHQHYDRIKRTFTAALMKAKAEDGYASNLPIFIVGFPRSGTTLTEQILASHPMVHGAGELDFLVDLTADAVVNNGAEIAFPESVPLLVAERLRQLGATYVERLSRFDPAATHITDKNLSSFGLLGFIHLILPKAKIIHVKRDPVDTCLSGFLQKFAEKAVRFTYDLGELGRYYRLYQDMMDHWRRLLPPGFMLEVQYENIVENLEAEARRIIDYCGLAWDERCLEFHLSERTVRTASVSQVRQPIYRSSVQRWRRYERHLGPLLEALELDRISSDQTEAPTV